MDVKFSQLSVSSVPSGGRHQDQMDLRRGPWMDDEDLALISYIARHGEGHWNSLARRAGLKRTGKSCRLRWLNYLRPDVRRGNITLEEQLLILELHSHLGNRWSKIAQYLPGRTDNEIKNYWRTRVQKHANQLKCDVNSRLFKDTMKYLWMPRLFERIHFQGATATTGDSLGGYSTTTSAAATATGTKGYYRHHFNDNSMGSSITQAVYTPVDSTMAATTSSDSFPARVSHSPASDDSGNQYEYLPIFESPNPDCEFRVDNRVGFEESFAGPAGYFNYNSVFSTILEENGNLDWLDGGETSDSLPKVENVWSLQQQQLATSVCDKFSYMT